MFTSVEQQRPTVPHTRTRNRVDTEDASIDLSSAEKEIQQWLESDLGVCFLPGKNMYENLESGQLLCRLLAHHCPESINIHEIHEFEDLFDGSGTPSREIYVTRARRNVQLFMDGCARIGMKPLNKQFTFQDLYLQKNRSIICQFLQSLREHLKQLREKNAMSLSSSNVISALMDHARVTSIPDDDFDDDDDDEIVIPHTAAHRVSKPLPAPPVSSLKMAVNKLQQLQTQQDSTVETAVDPPTPMMSRVDSGVFTLDSLKRKQQKRRAMLDKAQLAAMAVGAFKSIAQEKKRERQPLALFQYPSDDEVITFSTVIRAIVAVFVLPAVIVGVLFLNWRVRRSAEKEKK